MFRMNTKPVLSTNKNPQGNRNGQWIHLEDLRYQTETINFIGKWNGSVRDHNVIKIWSLGNYFFFLPKSSVCVVTKSAYHFWSFCMNGREKNEAKVHLAPKKCLFQSQSHPPHILNKFWKKMCRNLWFGEICNKNIDSLQSSTLSGSFLQNAAVINNSKQKCSSNFVNFIDNQFWIPSFHKFQTIF